MPFNDNTRDLTLGDPQAPQDPNSLSLYDAVAGFYQRALGREGTPEEINQWVQGKGPGDLGAIQQAIYGSPEAQAWSARQQQAPKDVGVTPTDTGQTSSGGGVSAPASGPVAGPVAGPAAASSSTQTFGQNAPQFQGPSYTPPPAFSYGDFVAPDPNDLNNDPSYKFTLGQEQSAIQRSAAARGVLNTGGTIYDLLSNAKDLANTGYAGLWNRKMGEYSTNRGNALQNYNTNYGTQYKDPYQYKYQGAQDLYNSNIHSYDVGQQYGWAKNLFDTGQSNNTRDFEWNKARDLFDEKYRLLSL